MLELAAAGSAHSVRADVSPEEAYATVNFLAALPAMHRASSTATDAGALRPLPGPVVMPPATLGADPATLSYYALPGNTTSSFDVESAAAAGPAAHDARAAASSDMTAHAAVPDVPRGSAPAAMSALPLPPVNSVLGPHHVQQPAPASPVAEAVPSAAQALPPNPSDAPQAAGSVAGSTHTDEPELGTVNFLAMPAAQGQAALSSPADGDAALQQEETITSNISETSHVHVSRHSPPMPGAEQHEQLATMNSNTSGAFADFGTVNFQLMLPGSGDVAISPEAEPPANKTVGPSHEQEQTAQSTRTLTSSPSNAATNAADDRTGPASPALADRSKAGSHSNSCAQRNVLDDTLLGTVTVLRRPSETAHHAEQSDTTCQTQSEAARSNVAADVSGAAQRGASGQHAPGEHGADGLLQECSALAQLQAANVGDSWTADHSSLSAQLVPIWLDTIAEASLEHTMAATGPQTAPSDDAMHVVDTAASPATQEPSSSLNGAASWPLPGAEKGQATAAGSSPPQAVQASTSTQMMDQSACAAAASESDALLAAQRSAGDLIDLASAPSDGATLQHPGVPDKERPEGTASIARDCASGAAIASAPTAKEPKRTSTQASKEPALDCAAEAQPAQLGETKSEHAGGVTSGAPGLDSGLDGDSCNDGTLSYDAAGVFRRAVLDTAALAAHAQGLLVHATSSLSTAAAAAEDSGGPESITGSQPGSSAHLVDKHMQSEASAVASSAQQLPECLHSSSASAGKQHQTARTLAHSPCEQNGALAVVQSQSGPVAVLSSTEVESSCGLLGQTSGGCEAFGEAHVRMDAIAPAASASGHPQEAVGPDLASAAVELTQLSPMAQHQPQPWASRAASALGASHTQRPDAAVERVHSHASQQARARSAASGSPSAGHAASTMPHSPASPRTGRAMAVSSSVPCHAVAHGAANTSVVLGILVETCRLDSTAHTRNTRLTAGRLHRPPVPGHDEDLQHRRNSGPALAKHFPWRLDAQEQMATRQLAATVRAQTRAHQRAAALRVALPDVSRAVQDTAAERARLAAVSRQAADGTVAGLFSMYEAKRRARTRLTVPVRVASTLSQPAEAVSAW